jgi:hypothetical protein
MMPRSPRGASSCGFSNAPFALRFSLPQATPLGIAPRLVAAGCGTLCASLQTPRLWRSCEGRLMPRDRNPSLHRQVGQEIR